MHRYQMQSLLCFNEPNFETYNIIKKMKKQARKKKIQPNPINHC